MRGGSARVNTFKNKADQDCEILSYFPQVDLRMLGLRVILPAQLRNNNLTVLMVWSGQTTARPRTETFSRRAPPRFLFRWPGPHPYFHCLIAVLRIAVTTPHDFHDSDKIPSLTFVRLNGFTHSHSRQQQKRCMADSSKIEGVELRSR